MSNSTLNVLIVEDDTDIRALLALNLQRAACHPRCAGSVAEAEALLRDQLPDLVLLDWMLPEVSGVTFARRLRTDPRTAGVAIIMITSRDRGGSDHRTGSRCRRLHHQAVFPARNPRPHPGRGAPLQAASHRQHG